MKKPLLRFLSLWLLCAVLFPFGTANAQDENLPGAATAFVKSTINDIEVKWYMAGEAEEPSWPETFDGSLFPPIGWEIKASNTITDPLRDLTEDEKEGDVEEGYEGLKHWARVSTSTYDLDHLTLGSHFVVISAPVDNCLWMISPEKKIEAGKSLKYDLRTETLGSDYTDISLMVFVDGAWKELKKYSEDVSSNLFAKPEYLDLNEYAGKTVKFAFVQTKSGWMFAFDNVDIVDTPENTSCGKAINRELKPFTLKGSQDVKRSDVTGFEIYRKEGSEDFEKIATLAADVRSYLDQALELNDYSYKVKVVYGDKFSADENNPELSTYTINPIVKLSLDKHIYGVDEEVTITPEILGTVNSLDWDFGDGATPKTSDVLGAVTTSFSTYGEKGIKVTVNGNEANVATVSATVQLGSAEYLAPKLLELTNNYGRPMLSWTSPFIKNKIIEDFEGAEFPPVGWEIKASDDLSGNNLVDPKMNTWSTCTSSSFKGEGGKYIKNGKQSAGISNKAGIGDDPDVNWLITKDIKVDSEEFLYFDMFYETRISYPSLLNIMIFSDGKWESIKRYGSFSVDNMFERQEKLDLSNYVSKNIKIAFVYKYSDSFNLSIDNVIVGNTEKFDIPEDFIGFNLYRNKEVIKIIGSGGTSSYIDTENEEGYNEYVITATYKGDKESFGTNVETNYFVEKRKTPYSSDFTERPVEWISYCDKLHWAHGTSTDFVNKKDEEVFPGNETNFFAYNVSTYSKYKKVAGALGSPFFDLSNETEVTVTFDYFNNSIDDAENSKIYFGYRLEDNTGWILKERLPITTKWESYTFKVPRELMTEHIQFCFFVKKERAVIGGLAIDNFAINHLGGKHYEVSYNNCKIDKDTEIDGGRVEGKASRTYELTIHNIGKEDINISEIKAEGESFKLEGENTYVIKPNEKETVKVTYTPAAEDKAYTGNISFKSDAVEGDYTCSINTIKSDKAEWTYMLYLYEDGTGLNGKNDLNEWEVNGSIPGVLNYIVLYDANDDSRDGIYYVNKDTDGQNKKIISKRISTHMNKGLDMNDMNTLKEFILWAQKEYPAKHYGLNVWDHGTGIFTGSSGGAPTRSAVGKVDLWELSEALDPFVEQAGKKLDIFGFDVCLLGQVETAYELADYTDNVIFSEKTAPASGWNYAETFAPLNENPTYPIKDFITNHVEKFIASNEVGGSQNYWDKAQVATQSAIDTKILKEEFAPALNVFADYLISNMSTLQDKIKEAIEKAWVYKDDGYLEHKDFGSFIKELMKLEVGDEVKAEAQKVLDAYNKSIIISETTTPETVQGATGMKIWMPLNISENVNAKYYYDNLKYLNIGELKWYNMLYALENPTPKEGQEAVIIYDTHVIFPGDKISFIDKTPAFPAITTRQWIVTPSKGVEFVDGTDANSEKPVIKFTEPNFYSVKLTSSNGNNTFVKELKYRFTVKNTYFEKPVDLAGEVENEKNVVLNWGQPGSNLSLYETFESGTLNGWQSLQSYTLDSKLEETTGEYDFSEYGFLIWHVFNVNDLPSGLELSNSGNYAIGLSYEAGSVMHEPLLQWAVSPEVKAEDGDILSLWPRYLSSDKDKTLFRVMIHDGEKWNQELFWKDKTNTSFFTGLVRIDLSKYAGKTIKVGLVHQYNNAYMLIIDDIAITNPSKGKTAVIAELPSRNMFDVDVDRNLLETDRSSGRLVAEGKPVAYNIYRDGEKIATVDGAENTTYTDKGLEDGKYKYKVTMTYANPDGESTFSNVAEINVGDVDGVAETVLSNVRIAPNPSNGNFKVMMNNEKVDVINIYSVQGKLLQSLNVNQNVVDIAGLESGVYILKLKGENGEAVRKAIVK
ncbi:MAG: clostripain-related cysteine peptidase [Hyphomicrobiales bacterium]